METEAATPAKQLPCPSVYERQAARATVAVLTETLGKPVADVLADLRRLAAADG